MLLEQYCQEREKKKDLSISIVCVVYIAGEEEKEHVVKEHGESLAITFFFGNWICLVLEMIIVFMLRINKGKT